MTLFSTFVALEVLLRRLGLLLRLFGWNSGALLLICMFILQLSDLRESFLRSLPCLRVIALSAVANDTPIDEPVDFFAANLLLANK